MTMPHDSEQKRLDIRKYPNRRYYDATHSKHLTLEEIRSLIRDGYDVKVTDSKTGADITAQVLTQIVLELETEKIDSFPVALLLQMIRANDLFVKDFVEKYFNQAFSAYLEYQKQMGQRLREMQGNAGIFAPFSAWPQAMMNPFVSPFATNESPKSSPTRDASQSEPNAQETRDVIDELRQQLADLQRQIKQRQPRSRKR